MYEEARDTSVQQHLTVAVLNTVIAAVAAPLLLLCCTAKCHSKACRTRLLPHATVPYAPGVQGSRGAAGEENAKILVLHPMTAVAPELRISCHHILLLRFLFSVHGGETHPDVANAYRSTGIVY